MTIVYHTMYIRLYIHTYIKTTALGNCGFVVAVINQFNNMPHNTMILLFTTQVLFIIVFYGFAGYTLGFAYCRYTGGYVKRSTWSTHDIRRQRFTMSLQLL